ncbi:MAG TPA: three-Cys-motif partner protein TcmP, partial [Adhaeribacter sp.]|nr:three-Cys-motif partner protein TcmP [Adhaeribacter sp.]
MLPSSSNFFQTKRSLSEIKAELLPAYFKIWAETKAVEELVLADLIAGNGLEANGENATALQIAETFREDENATENDPKTLELFLSDASSTNLEKLKQHLVIPEEEGTRLPENIHFLNEPGTRETLSELLQKVPGLLVADPFGYALAAEIAAETLENPSADLVLLFDYKRLEKTFLAEIPIVFIARIFGADLPAVKAKFRLQKSAKLREQFLTEQLEKAFRDMEFYPLTFRMNTPGKLAGSSYLLLAGKTIATYLAAKEWLQTYSELQEDGVPLFGANLNYQPAAIPGFSE